MFESRMVQRYLMGFMSKPIAVSKPIRAAIFVLLATACAPLLADSAPLKQIKVTNAEDLAPIDNGRWVIASSYVGGALKQGMLSAIERDSGAVYQLYPPTTKHATEATAPRATIAGCDLPVAAEQFAPHGIAVQRIDGRDLLFVVNHGGRESIELFEIISGKQPALAWRGCIHYPKGAMGNAVAVTPDNRLYATNMGAAIDGKPRAQRWMGDVLTRSQAEGWSTLPHSDIYAPNGLLVANDGRQLFVASWAAGEVIKLTQPSDGAQPTRQTLKLPFLPDNLRWGRDGEIVAAGLHASAQDVVHCMMTKRPCDISIPTGVASIGAAAFDLQCTRKLSLLQGTVAIPVGDTLWVGPVRGESIWVVDADSKQWDHCQ